MGNCSASIAVGTIQDARATLDVSIMYDLAAGIVVSSLSLFMHAIVLLSSMQGCWAKLFGTGCTWQLRGLVKTSVNLIRLPDRRWLSRGRD